jgi:hypothetical protein
MIILAILATLGAIGWTVLVFGANAMSDAPQQGFQFGGSILIAWVVVAAVWLGWWIG